MGSWLGSSEKKGGGYRMSKAARQDSRMERRALRKMERAGIFVSIVKEWGKQSFFGYEGICGAFVVLVFTREVPRQ